MKFSLVLATLNRHKDFNKFIYYLDHQSHKNFELIVVDQSDNEYTKRVCDKYKDRIEIKYIHLDKKGLSYARNEGMKYVRGDVVAFPDDDCWYSEELLEEVSSYFEKNNVDGICGCPVDKNGKMLINNYLRSKVILNKYNVWNGGISFTIFLKKIIVDSIGKFDEMLGVGANTPYGSGEETDYLLRSIDKNFKIIYIPKITVYHPRKDSVIDAMGPKRSRSYGRGMGFVLKKHKYSIGYLIKVLIRPAGGAVLALLSLRWSLVLYRLNTFLGRIEGYFHRKEEKD